jgi:hypothetical protein
VTLSVLRAASLLVLLGLTACSGGGGGGGGGATTITPPATPSGLSATPASGLVDLVWEAGTEPDLVGYRVYRSTTPGEGFVELTVDPLPGTSYRDTGLLNGTTYHYTVAAEDGEGNLSAPSDEVLATPLPSSDAALASLLVAGAELLPAFDPETLEYSVGPEGLLQRGSLELTVAARDAAASVRVDGEEREAGAPGTIDLAVGVTPVLVEVTAEDGSTRTYTVVCRREALSAQADHLKASNTGAGDAFGLSFAIDGDTLAVGAYHESSSATGVGGDGSDDGALESGAVYVFTRSGGAWVEEAYLKASNADPEDFFGRSVALEGDTLVVGAYHESSAATGVDGDQASNGATRSGAVYVFTRARSVWSQEAYLKASNAGPGDFFGRSVALSGDTLVVGAYGEDSDATGVDGDGASNLAPFSGAAYVFRRSGGAWSQEAYLKAHNTGTFDYFGISVAVDGETLAVGAWGESSASAGVGGDPSDNSAPFCGAAYVFTHDGGSWSQQAYLKASNAELGDFFGSAVALSGDTLVVGAPEEAAEATGVDGDGSGNAAAGSGAAYVFTRDGGVWSQQAYLKASNTGASDGFGTAVAVAGDALVVGAPGEASSATGIGGDGALDDAVGSGAAYLYTRTAGVWSQQAYLKASSADASDALGSCVALSGDTVATGAPGEASSALGPGGDPTDNGAPGAGAVQVFE